MINEMFPNIRSLVVAFVAGFKSIMFTQVRQDPNCATGTPSFRLHIADPVVINVPYIYEDVSLTTLAIVFDGSVTETSKWSLRTSEISLLIMSHLFILILLMPHFTFYIYPPIPTKVTVLQNVFDWYFVSNKSVFFVKLM